MGSRRQGGAVSEEVGLWLVAALTCITIALTVTSIRITRETTRINKRNAVLLAAVAERWAEVNRLYAKNLARLRDMDN